MNPNTYSDHLSKLESRRIKPNFLTIGKNSDGVPVVVPGTSRLDAMNAWKTAVNQFNQQEVHIYKLKDGKYEYHAESVSEASGGKAKADTDTRQKQQSLYAFENFVHSVAVSKDFAPEARKELVQAFCEAFEAIGGSNSELIATIDQLESETAES